MATASKVRARCRERVASLRISQPYCEERFTAILGEQLGSTVRLVPLRLPMGCTALWLGFTGADRIGYNAGWLAHELQLAGHAIGHLLLGHCGEGRDGGQFACLAGSLGGEDRRRLCALLHYPDDGASRLFSDGEERAASIFSCMLAEALGIPCGGRVADEYNGDSHVCVG